VREDGRNCKKNLLTQQGATKLPKCSRGARSTDGNGIEVLNGAELCGGEDTEGGIPPTGISCLCGSTKIRQGKEYEGRKSAVKTQRRG